MLRKARMKLPSSPTPSVGSGTSYCPLPMRSARAVSRLSGMKAQDTAELFFEDVRVPAANLVGTEGMGFIHLMTNLIQVLYSAEAQLIITLPRLVRTLELIKKERAEQDEKMAAQVHRT